MSAAAVSVAANINCKEGTPRHHQHHLNRRVKACIWSSALARPILAACIPAAAAALCWRCAAFSGFAPLRAELFLAMATSLGMDGELRLYARELGHSGALFGLGVLEWEGGVKVMRNLFELADVYGCVVQTVNE